MIFEVTHENEPPTYVISAHHVWRPGAFESRAAARHAQRLSDEELQVLQDEANALAGRSGGVITHAAIKKTLAQRSKPA